MKALRNILSPLIFALALVALWQGVAEFRLVSPVFLPSPARAVEEIILRIEDATLWEPLLATTRRMIFGWLLASVAGIALGAAIGLSRLARELLEPSLEFLRPLPASAMIPVAVLFFGLTENMAAFVIAFGSIWPVLMSSIYGFSHVRGRLQEVSALLGLTRLEFLRKIALPSAAPDILAGMRTGLAVSLILAVVTEMQASLPGLGHDLHMAQRSFRSAELFAGLIMLGVLGVVINQGLQAVERRVLRWRL